MYKNRLSLIVAVCLLAACLYLTCSGCGNGGFSPEKLEEIDAVFRSGTSSLAGTTAFISALEDFDLENAAFLDDALSAVDASREAAQMLLASVEELQGFTYGGALSTMGGYMEEYAALAVEAVQELNGIYDALQGMLQAIEPILREEAVITQLEAPSSDAELLDRLGRLSAALDASLAELPGIEVPAQLAEYKSLLEGIFTKLQKLVRDLTTTVSEQNAEEDMEYNPDFISLQESMEDYSRVVGELYDSLEISSIDPLVEKVELELNRLFLEEDQ